MKKKIVAILLCLTLVLMAVPNMTAFANETVKVELDGKVLNFDVPPQLINKRTMVPLRAIFEALGATVYWDDNTQTVLAVRSDKQITMKIGSYTMVVNDQTVILDTPSCMVNDRTLVPVRAISEAFGCSVQWEDSTQTVFINTVNTTATPTPVPTYTPAVRAENNAYPEAYNALKNIIMSKGTYKDGNYTIYHFFEDGGGMMLIYVPSDEEIQMFLMSKMDSGRTHRCLITVYAYTNPEFYYDITNGTNDVEYQRGTFKSPYRPYEKTDGNIPSYLIEVTNKVINSAFALMDIVLKIETRMSFADFGMYYTE